MLLTLALGAAQAHRPHSVITALVAAEDGIAWSLLYREGVVGLLRSDDDGAHWDYVGGPPVADALVDLALLEGEGRRTLAAVSTEGRIWLSGDDGASWEAYELGSRARSVTAAGQGFAVGCDGGLLAVSTEGVVSALSEVPAVIDVSAYDGGVLGVSLTGDIARVGEGEELLPALPGGVSPWAAVDVEGTIVVGTSDGAYALEGEDWVACGELPVTVLESHSEEVPLLRYDGERLLAASGRQALFASEDGCRSWRFYDSGVTIGYDGNGLATSPDEAWSALIWRGDRVLVAGFDGVTGSVDGGRSFREAVMLAGDSVRGVAFDHQWPSLPRLWFGGYGGGSWFTDDGGRTWTGTAAGLGAEGEYGEDIYAYGIAGSAEGGFYSGALIPYYSADGLSWSRLDVPMPFTTTFDRQGDRLLAFGGLTGREVNLVSQSLDGGQTWEALDGLNDKLDGSYLSGLRAAAVDGESGWLATPAAGVWAWYSRDLETWEEWPTDAASGGTVGAATWPPETGERLVVVSRQGQAWISPLDGGRPGAWRSVDIPFSGDIQDFAAADDGSFFVIDRAGQLARSEDGGERWVQVGQPIPAPLNVLAVAPDFAEHGTLMVGTWAGTWWSADRGESFHQLPRYDRYEDGSVLLRCSTAAGAPCASYSDEAQGNGGGLLIGPGDRLRFSLTGTGFTLLGAAAGDSAELLIDDEVYTLEGEGPHGISGLGSGWHDVDLSTSGSFHLDAVEIEGEGEVMPLLGGGAGGGDDSGDTGGGEDSGGEDSGGGLDSADPADTGGDGKGCGCASSRGGGPWLGLLAVLALGRRRGR